MQSQSSGGVLKNKFNLGQNTKRLFQVLVWHPLITTKTELGYYHHRWRARVAPLVALRSQEIRKFQESSENALKGIKVKCPPGNPR